MEKRLKARLNEFVEVEKKIKRSQNIFSIKYLHINGSVVRWLRKLRKHMQIHKHPDRFLFRVSGVLWDLWGDFWFILLVVQFLVVCILTLIIWWIAQITLNEVLIQHRSIQICLFWGPLKYFCFGLTIYSALLHVL